LWRDAGDIQRLLRKANDPDDSSLLDSVYYQERLASCYKDTLKAPKAPAEVPKISELDLFVTGTNAHGVISTIYDELGHPIDVKNHRALFQLQYRGDGRSMRKNDFAFGDVNPATGKRSQVTSDDLGKLSRLTSGFPVAFRPTEVTKEDVNLFRWGKLNAPAVYMDGGILNNKPFTSTIGAIASRTATREVERFLIYVEPRPEQFQMLIGTPATPTLVEAGFNSLTSIPSYQSIASDLEAIEAHNERAQRFQKILESLPDLPHRGLEDLLSVGVLPMEQSHSATSYLAARLTMVNDAAVGAILDNKSGHRQFFPPEQATKLASAANPCSQDGAQSEQDCRRSGRLLVQSFWCWKGIDKNQTLQAYDVFYRKRRSDYLSGVLMKALKGSCDKESLKVPTETWEAVNHLFKLCEITEWAMKTWLTRQDLNWAELSSRYPDIDGLDECDRVKLLAEIATEKWGEVQNHLDRLMTCDIEVPTFDFDIDGLRTRREKYYNSLLQWLDAPASGTSANLLQRLDEAQKDAIAKLVQTPDTAISGKILLDETCNFIDVDQQLLPLQIGSSFESTNVVRVVRFSPLDAQRGLSKGPVDQKVRGTALANFGAFFKKGWRANDIMIGRFDSACLLTECLLTKERLASVAKERPGYSLSASTVARCLPKADAVKLSTEINAYLAATKPSKEAWESLVDQIVLAAQEEILKEEWPRIAQCTIEQQYAWSRYKRDDSTPNGLHFPSRWTAAKSSPDELLVQIAANAIKNGDLPPYAAPSGKDFLEEIPLTAMQEYISLGMVRLGRSIGASVPLEHRQAVTDGLIYKITMRWVPTFFYRLTNTRRTQPGWILIPIVLLGNLALLTTLVFAWLLQQEKHLPLELAALTTALVVGALIVQWTLTQNRWRWVMLGILLLLLLGGVAFYMNSLSHSQLSIVMRCFFSIVGIIAAGAIPRRGVWAGIPAAILASAILFLIWRTQLGLVW
jgi:patatin-related protein